MHRIVEQTQATRLMHLSRKYLSDEYGLDGVGIDDRWELSGACEKRVEMIGKFGIFYFIFNSNV